MALYENHQPWTTRAVTGFMVGQFGLWTSVLYDFTVGTASAARLANSQSADPSPVIQVMLHPFWALLGLAVTVAGSALARDYVTNAVSEIREDRASRRVLLRTHTLLGRKTDPPLAFARGELRGVARVGSDQRRITLSPATDPDRRFWLYAEGLPVAERASAAAALGIPTELLGAPEQRAEEAAARGAGADSQPPGRLRFRNGKLVK